MADSRPSDSAAVSVDNELHDHPGAKRSRVWRYFGFKRIPGSTPPALDMEHTFCRKCGSKYKYNKNTTNMAFHLDHQHKGWTVNDSSSTSREPKQTQLPLMFQRQKSERDQRPLTKDKSNRINERLADLIVEKLLPFNFLESECLKAYSSELDERYTIPGRKSMMKILDTRYEKLRAKLSSDMKDCDVAITHDSWTSINTQSFDTVTGHFIDNNWMLKSAVLQTTHFPGTHTSVNIANHLQGTLDSWGIHNPICVTDNAANEKKAFEILELKRIGCYGHKINLIVKHSLNTPELNKLLARGRSVVTFFHQSPLATDVLLKKQTLLLEKSAQGHKLLQDVPTRWNSTVDMLKRLIEQAPAIHATLMDPTLSKKASELRNKVYSIEETVVANNLVELLGGFKTATEMLSSEKNPTHHLVMPILKKLEQETTIKEDDSAIIRKVKTEMMEQLRARFGAEIDVALLATILNPTTKLLSFLTDEEKERAKDLLRKEIQSESLLKVQFKQEKVENKGFNEGASQSEEPPAKVKKESLCEDSDKDWLDDIIVCGGESAGHIDSHILAEQELQGYLAEQHIPSKADGLYWWKEKAVYYPRISKVAKKYLAVPASSVPSERIFSLAGNIVRKKRSQLSTENVDKMIFLRKNTKALQ